MSEEDRRVPKLCCADSASFKTWSADNLRRYAQLDLSYRALLSCVRKYHPEVTDVGK